MPSCSDCQQWLYSDGWGKVLRAGQPVARAPGLPTPCHKCPKSKDGRPNPSAEMSPKNWLAYFYFRRCLVDATGILQRDRIVLRNNSVIHSLEEQLRERNSRGQLAKLLARALGGK